MHLGNLFLEAAKQLNSQPVFLISGETGTEKSELGNYLSEKICGSKLTRIDLNSDLSAVFEGHGKALLINGHISNEQQGFLLKNLHSLKNLLVITTTHFREDLYYALNAIHIMLAPLRSRKEEIEILATYFVGFYSKEYGKSFSGLNPKALEALKDYRWPGNTSELKAVIERAVLIETSPNLQLSKFRQENLRLVEEKITDFEGPPKALSEIRKEMDDQVVRKALLENLELYQGNVSAVARELKVDRANLLRLLKRFGISPDLFREQTA